jgi:hypothetical protein
MAMTGMVRMALQLGRAGIVVDCSTGPKMQAGHKRRSRLPFARFTRVRTGWQPRRRVHEDFKKAMADPRLQPETNPMPFDGKRLIYGGFQALVNAS